MHDTLPRRVLVSAVTIILVGAAVGTAGDKPLLDLRGVELAGGGATAYGEAFHGRAGVNYVYAQPTGEQSRLRAVFPLDAAPSGPLFLHLMARDDDAEAACPIEIVLNETTLFRGDSGFPDDTWAAHHYDIPGGVLKAGVNTLDIANRAAEGVSGMPPWFMVARVVIANREFNLDAPRRKPIEADFFVTLPGEMRPLPEPLPEGARPGFRIRGTKGWNWTAEQYLAEIPVLARYRMNFLMNCYLSLFAQEPRLENRWFEPLPESTRAGLAAVIESCGKHNIDFCFAVHPQLSSPRPIDPSSPADFDALWQNFAWAQSKGVKWFSLPLDDVQGMAGVRVDATEHARLVNELFARLRSGDPEAQLIFCPTWYWGDGTGKEQKPYLQTLARELHEDVYLFWTGDAVVGHVTRKAAETFRDLAQHRVILWDNYPVNDNHPTLHLGPLIHRDADLCEVLDGIMSNPHCTQNQINRIPLGTIADYAYNPAAYDPARSIGQSILHNARTPAQRDVLRDLVELYPGMLLTGGGTGWNPVMSRFSGLIAEPHTRHMADIYLDHASDTARRMQEHFGETFAPARRTLLNDVRRMRAAYESRYGERTRR